MLCEGDHPPDNHVFNTMSKLLNPLHLKSMDHKEPCQLFGTLLGSRQFFQKSIAVFHRLELANETEVTGEKKAVVIDTILHHSHATDTKAPRETLIHSPLVAS